MIKIREIVFALVLIVLGIVSIALNDKLSFFCALILFVIGFVFLLKDLEYNVFMLAFLVSFFTFLLGSEAIWLMGWGDNKYLFPQEVDNHAYVSITISVMFLFLSYIATNSYLRKKHPVAVSETVLSDRVLSIRKVSLFFYYGLLVFKIIINLSELIFVRTFGYSNLYSDYNFQGPSFFIKLADMCTLSFFVFLGTLPSKKECKIPVLLYLCVTAITIFTGRRNDLITTLLLIFVYYCTRNKMNSGNKVWISRKKIYIFVILTPLLLSLLSTLSALRSGTQDNLTISYFKGIGDFFSQQGFSINIIKWEKSLENSIPNKIYSLGQTYEFFTTRNFISRALFDFKSFSGQTVERALEGHRLSYLLSYLVFPWSYAHGYGVGSCYIAEAYHDFGYLGVSIINCLYGFLFANFNYNKYRGPIYMGISLLMMQSLLMAPRAYADSFIGTVLDFSNIEILLLIWLISKHVNQRRGVSNQAEGDLYQKI